MRRYAHTYARLQSCEATAWSNASVASGRLASSSNTVREAFLARRIGLRMRAMMTPAIAMIAMIIRISEIGGAPCPFQLRASVNQRMIASTKRTTGLGASEYSTRESSLSSQSRASSSSGVSGLRR